ncbi:cytochrome P450 [Phlebopus sp. FC_14]|nr:cytochrome P450 [Phlebopus sp. FC_14]
MPVFLDVCLAGLGLYLVKQLVFARASPPLPPGPSGWPLVRNLFDFPSKKAWLKFADLADQYGDIFSMSVLGTQTIILNSAKTTSDILDKQSAICSNRPHLVMADDLIGWDKGFLFMQYGERFRQTRKFFHHHLGTRTSLAAFSSVEEEETRRFLMNVLKSPEDLLDHIRKTAGSIILKISYGYSVQESNDPLVKLANDAMENISMVATPGAFLVDILPILQYLPEWFPGAGFQRDAKRYRQLVVETVTRPYQFVLDQLANGTARPSFTTKLLEGAREATAEEEDVIMWSSLSMYLADMIRQVVSAIYSFFLAMTIYPEVQKQAQMELDAVIGTDRLPSLDDRDALPYISAICKEVLRWYVVTPLAVPHVCTGDIIYNGFLIPKGSYLIPNIWSILHDETTYPDPEIFRPERFLGNNPQPDPQNACFGYGRRICPGLHLAEASIFISVAMSLSVFKVLRYVENGVAIIPEVIMQEGTVSHPKPFKCRITPRSSKVEAIIHGVN